MIRSPANAVALYLSAALVLGTLAVSDGCANLGATGNDRVATALDVLADVIDPAYKLAVDGCLAREQLALDEAKAGRSTVEQATALIAQTRVRCDALWQAFAAIRLAHLKADELLNSGEFARAEEQLTELRKLWRTLGTGAPP